MALGLLTWECVPDLVPIDATFEPNAANRPVYDRGFAAFVDLYEGTKKIYRAAERRAVTSTREPDRHGEDARHRNEPRRQDQPEGGRAGRARLRKVPAVQRRLEKQYEVILNELRPSLRPYAGKIPSYSALPEDGRPRDEVLDELRAMAGLEVSRWQDGYVSGGVYHGDAEHIAFLNEVYALHSQANPLHMTCGPARRSSKRRSCP